MAVLILKEHSTPIKSTSEEKQRVLVSRTGELLAWQSAVQCYQNKRYWTEPEVSTTTWEPPFPIYSLFKRSLCHIPLILCSILLKTWVSHTSWTLSVFLKSTNFNSVQLARIVDLGISKAVNAVWLYFKEECSYQRVYKKVSLFVTPPHVRDSNKSGPNTPFHTHFSPKCLLWRGRGMRNVRAGVAEGNLNWFQVFTEHHQYSTGDISPQARLFLPMVGGMIYITSECFSFISYASTCPQRALVWSSVSSGLQKSPLFSSPADNWVGESPYFGVKALGVHFCYMPKPHSPNQPLLLLKGIVTIPFDLFFIF